MYLCAKKKTSFNDSKSKVFFLLFHLNFFILVAFLHFFT